MKNIISIFAAFLFTANVFAQAPEKMSYQAVVRDANGVLISNSLIGVQVSITKSAFFPIIVYSETHSATTNVNGLLTLAIGTGTPTYGSFSTINWGEGTYNISTTIDLTGGTNFNGGLLSTTQLLSVPYAMYAKASGTSAQTSTGCPDGTTIGEIKYWDGTEWITIAPALNGNFLQLLNGVPTWSNISSTVELPTVNTSNPSNVTNNSASCDGYVCSGGGGTVAERGICYGTSPNPTVVGAKVICGNGLGSFTANISGLTPGLIYYARAYATNNAGTVYGEGVQFSTLVQPICGTYTITDYDGNTYNTVQIGSQCWMKQNLATTHYADGTALVDGTSAGSISYDNTTKYWFVYDNILAHKATYGLLYTWVAAMNEAASSSNNPSGVQGACPSGWHLPSDDEWKQMEMFLGMAQSQADATGWRGTDQGGKLKETGTSHWVSPNTGATNTSGFTALPGGSRGNSGSFYYIGYSGNWWTATESSISDSWFRHLSSNFFANVYRDTSPKNTGYSVRCVRDN